MKKYTLISIAFIFLTIVLSTCTKIESYSDIPQINYLYVNVEPNSQNLLGQKVHFVELNFEIIDGNGDIGNDSIANFFNKFLVKENNEFREYYSNDSIQYRIPKFEIPEGQNKTFKADIKIEFEYFPVLMPYDTVKYEFYVLDRAGNKSNVAESEEIIFSNY